MIRTPGLYLPVWQQRDYYKNILNMHRGDLIGFWRLNEKSGGTAVDSSPRGNDSTYNGATLANAPGPDKVHVPYFSGSDTNVNIRTSTNTFDIDWNGNLFSMIAWGKVDGAERWSDTSTYRYLIHIRATDTAYYVVMGKSTTANQIEWRRRGGGAIVNTTYTFATSGPTTWFCMGMTHDQSVPVLNYYFYDKSLGFVVLTPSNSTGLTDWGNNPPIEGVTLLGAGSLTLQEWIGWLGPCAVWKRKLTESEMRKVMIP